ncbi:hypothetical protein NIES2100_00880 [Calothrix sp. NIES-2100]|uniref:hypothetical protein n=1 Tax=Calothrix sp. NIES-2100 TaxID=1954172 RepID=UPI000B5EEEE9|nr:hypothetical protein NIES2100_00880 [Calothrix sp. NIES-2100]
MQHPFALNLSDLEMIECDFEENLSEEEAVQVQGGTVFTTLALGEEGGEVTTKALNEEGGEVTTLALGEEGGSGGIQCISAPCPGSETGGTPKPPVTRAKFENGGDHVYTKARYGLEAGGW